MPDLLHPIQAVSDRTGLSAHVIRIWEKRYAAVTPERTPTNRRLYSEDQIARLLLLKRLTEAGHGIGYVAKLPTEKLQALVADAASVTLTKTVGGAHLRAVNPELLTEALAAVHALDAPRLGKLLKDAEVQLGAQGILQRLIAPLAHAIGEQWRDGTITAAHEHFASAVLRMFLSHAAKPFAASPNAPMLAVATPTGQLHELGALLAGATAANLDWRVVYLGASLASADIAGAVKQNQARAVALSIVYPEDDPNLGAELARLRDVLPDTPVIAGGRAAAAYRATLDKIGAHTVTDLVQLGETLDRLRQLG